MQKSHFRFSMFVGFIVMLVGVVIATKALIGFAHIALGLAMMALALVMRTAKQNESGAFALQPVRAEVSKKRYRDIVRS